MKLLRMMRKELRDILRERTLVASFGVQLLLAGFSTLLLTGLTALYAPGSAATFPPADVAYVGDGEFIQYVLPARNLDVSATSQDAALAGFDSGDFDVVLIETTAPDDVRRVTMLLAEGEFQTSLLLTQLRGLLVEYEEQLRLENQHRLEHEVLGLRTSGIETPAYGFVHAVLLPLLTLAPVFLSGSIAGDTLSGESRSRALGVLRSAPLGTPTIVAGKVLLPLLLVPVQVLLWIGLFRLNGFIVPGWAGVLLVATLLACLFVGAGLWIAATVKDETSTQSAYAVVVLALGVGSLYLPREPLNLIAMVGIGRWDGATLSTVIILAAATAVAFIAGLWRTSRAVAYGRL